MSTEGSEALFCLHASPILTAVVEAKNGHFGVGDGEGNRHSPFEADNAQPAANVIATLASLAGELEAGTVGFKALDVAQRYINAGTFSYPVTQTKKIASRFRRKSNSATSQRRALRFDV
jgi:hypothetical protein